MTTIHKYWIQYTACLLHDIESGIYYFIVKVVENLRDGKTKERCNLLCLFVDPESELMKRILSRNKNCQKLNISFLYFKIHQNTLSESSLLSLINFKH